MNYHLNCFCIISGNGVFSYSSRSPVGIKIEVMYKEHGHDNNHKIYSESEADFLFVDNKIIINNHNVLNDF